VLSYEDRARDYECLIVASDVGVVFVGQLHTTKRVVEDRWRYGYVEEEEDIRLENERLIEWINEILRTRNVALIEDIHEEWDNRYRSIVVKYRTCELSLVGELVAIVDPVASAYPNTGLVRVLMENGSLDLRILRSM